MGSVARQLFAGQPSVAPNGLWLGQGSDLKTQMPTFTPPFLRLPADVEWFVCAQ